MVTVAYRPGLLFQSGAGEIWPRKPPPLSGEQSDKKQKSEEKKSKNWIKNPETFVEEQLHKKQKSEKEERNMLQ